MLEAVVGSEGAERVLLFLAARRQGYALEIDNTFGMQLSNAQKHLERMERDGPHWSLKHWPSGAGSTIERVSVNRTDQPLWRQPGLQNLTQ